MKEVILLKYGEIILKGANRPTFEAIMLKELRRRAAKCGSFSISFAQSTVFVIPEEGTTEAQFEAMYEAAKKTFGFAGICRAAVYDKTMDDVCRGIREYIVPKLSGARTFKCEGKRSDKTFPLKSPEICREAGGVILSAIPSLKVDVHNPDAVVNIEIRGDGAYLHVGQEKGAGGIPVGSGGRGLLLLSGGIDSPVAGYMMAKRGMKIEALHFDSYPYTSEQALEKVVSLAEIMSEYTGPMFMHVISLTEVQEALRAACNEDYFTLLLRRFMMTLADRVAKQFHCGALITGESLGQVASQTIEAINVTDPVATMPVFRPCIGLDKDEIVRYSRAMGAFETSILPYEDCCTVFTPRHPKTRPELEKVLAEEAKVDFEGLCERALATMRDIGIK
ncbi:MAG: tRNA 4-thiouridine(8) synthase ThiI [Clostridia bacterium]|nr:tRNA 4-thiouridine(8) synthase ThiI [Clostridia bacterium]